MTRRRRGLRSRLRMPALAEFIFRFGIVLLVGVYYDHQHMPPGAITVAAIGLLVGEQFTRRRAPELEQHYEETDVALRLGPLVRQHGEVVMQEVEAAVRRRALPQRRVLADAQRHREDRHGDGE